MRLAVRLALRHARRHGYDGPPFVWDEERRAHLRAQLDAFYFHKYGLSEEEVAYVLDPKAVHGADFPGETFRVLKENEIKRYREYRTQRLVLQYYRERAQEYYRVQGAPSLAARESPALVGATR